LVANAFSFAAQRTKLDLGVSTSPQSVELPKRTRREMKALSPSEATAFLEAAKEDPHGLVFAFGLATGMRPEEYLELQWKDIDLLRGTATVQRTLCWRRRTGGGWYFGQPKTSQSRRTVPLPVSIVRELGHHKARQAENATKKRSRLSGARYCFRYRLRWAFAF